MSSNEQLKGDSLRRQLEMSRAFAAEHGLELDDSLRDIGVSAWNGDNRKKGALGEFLELVKQGRIPQGSYLLVESLDRLSRDQVHEALRLFLDLLRGGIVIVTIADRQIYSDANLKNDWTKLIVSLTIMARAHEESVRKSQRVRDAFANKRKMIREGKKALASSLPGWIDQEKLPNGEVVFKLNEHATTVVRIFELAAQGMGQRQIARRLNEENRPTFRKSSGWHQPTIAGVLDNVAAIGSIRVSRTHPTVPGADEVIEDYFPAAVTQDLYDKAQRMRRQRLSMGRKGRTFSNLFSGMAVCDHCGGTMAVKIGGDSKHPTKYLQCYNHQRRLGCEKGKRSFRYDDLEAAVLDTLTEYALSDLFHTAALEQEAADLRGRIEKLGSEIHELNRANENLVAVLEKIGAMDADRIIARMGANSKRQIQRQNELEELRTELTMLEARGHDTASILMQLREERGRWSAMSVQDQYDARLRLHRALRTFIDFITFNSATEIVCVVIGSGLKAYEFRRGQLVRKFDAFERHINGRPGSLQPDHFKAAFPNESAEERARRSTAIDKLVAANR